MFLHIEESPRCVSIFHHSVKRQKKTAAVWSNEVNKAKLWIIKRKQRKAKLMLFIAPLFSGSCKMMMTSRCSLFLNGCLDTCLIGFSFSGLEKKEKIKTQKSRGKKKSMLQWAPAGSNFEEDNFIWCGLELTGKVLLLVTDTDRWTGKQHQLLRLHSK